MNTRIDVLRYRMATPEQRAEVDHYLEHALGRSALDVAEVDATTEGTVRITRPLGRQGLAWPQQQGAGLVIANGVPRLN